MDETSQQLLESFERRSDGPTPLTFTHYSETEKIFRRNGMLYGNWERSFSAACGAGWPSSIEEDAVIELRKVGDCASGKSVTMCEHR